MTDNNQNQNNLLGTTIPDHDLLTQNNPAQNLLAAVSTLTNATTTAATCPGGNGHGPPAAVFPGTATANAAPNHGGNGHGPPAAAAAPGAATANATTGQGGGTGHGPPAAAAAYGGPTLPHHPHGVVAALLAQGVSMEQLEKALKWQQQHETKQKEYWEQVCAQTTLTPFGFSHAGSNKMHLMWGVGTVHDSSNVPYVCHALQVFFQKPVGAP
jgi:hypothetical protein